MQKPSPQLEIMGSLVWRRACAGRLAPFPGSSEVLPCPVHGRPPRPRGDGRMELAVPGGAVQRQSIFPSWCPGTMCPCPVAKPTPAPPGHVFLDPNAQFFPTRITSGAAAPGCEWRGTGRLTLAGIAAGLDHRFQSLRNLQASPLPFSTPREVFALTLLSAKYMRTGAPLVYRPV